MKKIILTLALVIIAVLNTLAQEPIYINRDYTVKHPISFLTLNGNTEHVYDVDAGSSWKLTVKKTTTGNIVKFYIYGPDGKQALSRTWSNMTVMEFNTNDGCKGYNITKGNYSYLSVFQIYDENDEKKWTACLGKMLMHE